METADSTSNFIDRLDETARDRLLRAMVTRNYDREEVVINQHEISQDVFVLLEGTAQVTVYSEDGKAVAFRRIEAGDIFGELAAIDARPRSATVVALEPLSVGRLPVAAFRKITETVPAFTWALLGHLSQQTRVLTDRIFEFSTMLVRERLVVELVRQAANSGVESGVFELRPAPTHFDLAAKISCHREAVSREMSRLTKADLIAKTDGALILLDVAELAKLSPLGD
ncbi:MAG: Crp/Fnr family transcriptional regulator [Pseudomonadota bacterium]